jgi:hypothetical protein
VMAIIGGTPYAHSVNWVHAGLWGLAGGFIVEGLELYVAVRQKGKWPWKVDGESERDQAGPLAYAIAETIRMVIGGILAGASAASGQVTGPLAAVAIGVAAPVMVGHLTALLPIPAPAAGDPAPGAPGCTCLSPAAVDGKAHGDVLPGSRSPAVPRAAEHREG